MKKILLIMLVLFVANVACKKTSINGGTTCGCSPMLATELYLVLKSNAGLDLLNSANAGAIAKDKIELYRLDATGRVIPLKFSIRPPFGYGNEKFMFNQLFSADMGFMQKGIVNTAFLKINGKTYELGLELNTTNQYRIERVTIDKMDAQKDNGAVAAYVPIFYFTL